MQVFGNWMSKIDARKRFKDVKNSYPQYAQRAYELFVKCLEENDEDKLHTFLGDNLPPYPYSTPGISVERMFMYFSLGDLCRQMEKVDKENLHELWNENAWDWYVRRLLKIPFKAIEPGGETRIPDDFQSQELMQSIIITP